MKPRRRHPGTLERAVISSVRSAEWIEDTDQAAIWLLRYEAEALDNGRRQQTLDGVAAAPDRALAELASETTKMLRDLGLTPAARHRLGLWEAETDDAFAEVVRLAASAVGNTAE